MSLVKGTPLRKKLTRLAMTCSVVALITTAVSLGTYEWFFYRRVILNQLVTLSMITARNSSAALAFDNADDAQRVISALEAEPAILGVALYDDRGDRVANFARDPRTMTFPVTAPSDGQYLQDGRFEIVVPVAETKRFGTLLVEADISVLRGRITAYVAVLLITTTVSGFLAFLLARRLKKRITEPVQALAEAASSVQTKDDYSVRVTKRENDELGTLTDAFNGMLDRIQENQVELHRSEERLRLALDSAQIGTWDWDIERSDVKWDARNYAIYGVKFGERVTAEVFWKNIHPDDVAKVRAAIDAGFSSGGFATEFRLELESGLRFIVLRGLVLANVAGRPHRAVGVTIDITERRRAELRVVESEQRFRVVAEKAPALIWSCEANLKRDYFNRTWLSFTGRTLEQEMGDGWRASLYEEDRERWQAIASAAAGLTDPYSVEYRLRRADGALRWMIETASPRLAADGSFVGYLGTCIDITVRKENEAELEAHVRLRTHQLELANQELESFSYSVSHDLRSPVRVIQGYAEVALEEAEAGRIDTLAQPLHRISKAAKRMDELISAFITLARISRAELSAQRIDLSKISEEIVGQLRAVQPTRAVQFSLQRGLTALGDERLIRVVLDNLLGNAWKFTTGREPARIEFGQVPSKKGPAFFVRDNGAGFNEAFAGKLFQVFQRLHAASEFEGLGVGLNTVQRVIQRHGGEVWAEGRENEGATFFFTLPENAPELNREPAEAARP